MQVSETFLIRLKMHELPAYRLAQAAGIDPVRLSKLINGIERVQREDPRIIAVGQVLGLKPDQCFESGTLDTQRRAPAASAKR